jgi:GT2 family glycosyltransferase
MSRVDTRSPPGVGAAEGVKPPSVLVVLVTKDGAAWLPQCLLALSHQTHPRLGVVAVDNGSTDDSADLLAQTLGAERVIRLDENIGFAAALARGLASDLASDADYILFLHDDTLLAPNAVAGMVEAAERIEDVGVVGPKVVDWDRPEVLREIGQSADGFGFPYSPLEEGELDHGQYDRVREVMFVSSCAMLVSRRTCDRIGAPDDRLTGRSDDLDFCWRAQVAGYRVLMAPRAVARHRDASVRGDRPGPSVRPRARYERDRAALASLLKNYGMLSLAWVLPLYLALGSVRVVILALSRRFEDAYEVLAAWGWNIAHLPGTLTRRRQAQKARRVPDRRIRGAMVPAWIRLRRMAVTTAQTFLPRRTHDDEPTLSRRARLGRLALGHPVATAWVAAAVLAAFAYRHLAGASPLLGGGAVSYPPGPAGFFRELVSGVRTTGLGGTAAASPALGLLGLGSVLAFGSPPFLEKVLLLVLPAAAAVGCYRSVRAVTNEVVPAVVAAGCYGISGAVLWGVSQGRIPVLVFLAGLPWMVTKLAQAFDPARKVRPFRWVVGAGAGMAVLGSFFPAVVLPAALLVAASLAVPNAGSSRFRGLVRCAAAAGVAAVLVFPLTFGLLRGGGAGMLDLAGGPDFGALARLSLGPAPGSWVTGFFLPGAAALALLFVSGPSARAALRWSLAGIASLYLAWLAAAGYLPRALSDPVAYVGFAALLFSLLVGAGLAAALRGMTRISFGSRQLGAVAMALVLGVGLFAQVLQTAKGSWTVGSEERVSPAYPVAGRAPGPPYRVLWLGRAGGAAFPAPGGLPDGEVATGRLSVRYAVRSPAGASALDYARPAEGAGYRYLERVLRTILAGQTRHGGALLAPLGIRFVVAGSGDLPGGILHRLTRQVDMDLSPAQGMTILENPKALPPAAGVGDVTWSKAAASGSLSDTAMLPPATPTQLRGGGEMFAGVVPAGGRGVVLLTQQFDSHWRLMPSSGPAERPQEAFGWAVGFASPAEPSSIRVRYIAQGTRNAEIALLALLWLGALWITRRPVRRG